MLSMSRHRDRWRRGDEAMTGSTAEARSESAATQAPEIREAAKTSIGIIE